MSHPDYLRKYVFENLPSNLDGMIILDACCGIGQWGFELRTRDVGTPSIVGVDIYEPYIEILKGLNIYDQLHREDINDFLEKTSMYFDIGLLVECVEHLEKEDAIRLIENAEKKCDIIIASTPKDFVQPKNITKANPWNYHKSGDYSEIFKEHGYTEIKLDRGLHIQFALKNIYIKLTNRNRDSITTLWKKDTRK